MFYSLVIDPVEYHLEELSDALLELGAESVSAPKRGSLISILVNEDVRQKVYDLYGRLVIQEEEVPDEAWKNSHYYMSGPVEFSSRFTVIPAHSSQHVSDGTIVLDWRDAFGHGAHATTRLVALLLEEHASLEDEDAKGQHVLDAGAGTGILSIIARRLGYSNVAAVEYDSTAVLRCRENCNTNGYSDVEVIHGNVFDYNKTCHLVLANLPIEVLEQGGSRLSGLLSPGGYLLASGIGRQWREELLALMGKEMTVVQELNQDDWLALKLRRT